MKALHFVWFDDKLSKVEHYRAAIEAGYTSLRAKIQPFEIKKDALEVLEQWCRENSQTPPDLFIIDHIFNSTLPFGLKGSSVAHLLRNQFARVPMVCVTGMYDRPDSFDQEDISEYSALFLYQQLDNHIEDLYAIARDFPRLHPPGTKAREHFVSCMKPPKRDREDLMRLLPDEFQDKRHATTEHRVARWIFNVFLRRPGFVYDRLHVATFLGLTENGFAKIEGQFIKARYKGAFATENDPRWWVSEIRRILFGLVGEDAPDLPQFAGRMLAGVSERDFSVCYVSRKNTPPPEVVVASDTSKSASRRVVQRQFSARHPKDLGIAPGFESWLILAKSRA